MCDVRILIVDPKTSRMNSMTEREGTVEKGTKDKKLTSVSEDMFVDICNEYTDAFDAQPTHVTQFHMFATQRGYYITYAAMRKAWAIFKPKLNK